MASLWLPPSVTDPAGLDRAPAAPIMFDRAEHRNRGTLGIRNENSTPEWDNRIIATAVALGCPRHVAEQARVYPPARFALVQVWCLVQDAARGDKPSQAALDRIRKAWESVDEVSEIISAREQEADPAELQELLAS